MNNLRFFPTCRLASQLNSFMDAGRTNKFLSWVKNNAISHSNNSISILHQFPSLCLHKMLWRVRWYPGNTMDCTAGEEPWLRGIWLFSSGQLLWRKILFLSAKEAKLLFFCSWREEYMSSKAILKSNLLESLGRRTIISLLARHLEM